MSVSIQIRNQQTAFSPREQVTGEVSWQLDGVPKSAEVRLLWSTTGKGTEDVSVVETMPFPNPQALETRTFAMTLPDAPYSFSGALITLTWILELVVEPGGNTASIDLVMAPGGEAIVLPRRESAKKR